MSKNLEYAIMIFLTGLLIILFRWSENGRYEVRGGGINMDVIDTRSGDIWGLGKDSNNEAVWGKFPSIHK